MWGESASLPSRSHLAVSGTVTPSLGDLHPSESTNLPPSPQLKGRIDRR